MNVTKDGFKDRQLHIEDYLQMVSAEQKEYAEVSAHQGLLKTTTSSQIFRRTIYWNRFYGKDNLNKAYKKVKLTKEQAALTE